MRIVNLECEKWSILAENCRYDEDSSSWQHLLFMNNSEVAFITAGVEKQVPLSEVKLLKLTPADFPL